VLTAKIASPGEIERIRAFYHANAYNPEIGQADVFILAEEEGGGICGAMRLCMEEDTMLLRGMRVAEEKRRQGIGTQMLLAAQACFDKRECFCIAHRHLEAFYGQIGFAEIEASQAPAFLRERWKGYIRDHGMEVILMRRASPVEAPRIA